VCVCVCLCVSVAIFLNYVFLSRHNFIEPSQPSLNLTKQPVFIQFFYSQFFLPTRIKKTFLIKTCIFLSLKIVSYTCFCCGRNFCKGKSTKPFLLSSTNPQHWNRPFWILSLSLLCQIVISYHKRPFRSECSDGSINNAFLSENVSQYDYCAEKKRQKNNLFNHWIPNF